jgi:hypothetical protein
MSKRTRSTPNAQQQEALAYLANRAERSRRGTEDGKVTFEGFDLFVVDSILQGLGLISTEIPDQEQRRIVAQAAFRAGKNGVITGPSLLQALRDGEEEYFKKPARDFVFVSTLSIDRSFARTTIHTLKAKLTIGSPLPKRFMAARTVALNEARHSLPTVPPTNYIHAIVNVNARGPAEAVDIAMRELDMVRGIWNLHRNQGHGIRMSFGATRKPVNKVLLGPIHTLHNPDGSAADVGTWWYEPNYVSQVEPIKMADDRERLMHFTRRTRGAMRVVKYRRVIEDAIIRYSRALDQHDWDTGFMRLWAVIELLTGSTDIHDGSRALIRRAAFLWREHEHATHELRVLKEYRNGYVHASSSNSHVEVYLFVLKKYVEALIHYYLHSATRFNKMEHVLAVLDLPPEAEDLTLRAKLLLRARRLRRPASKTIAPKN